MSDLIEDQPELERERSPRRVRTARAKETLRKVQVEERVKTPDVGSPESERAQAENEEKDQRLNRTIHNICRGC
jgi:hypothetical protein